MQGQQHIKWVHSHICLMGIKELYPAVMQILVRVAKCFGCFQVIKIRYCHLACPRWKTTPTAAGQPSTGHSQGIGEGEDDVWISWTRSVDWDCEGIDELGCCSGCSNMNQMVRYFHCDGLQILSSTSPPPTRSLNIINCPGFCLLKTLNRHTSVSVQQIMIHVLPGRTYGDRGEEDERSGQRCGHRRRVCARNNSDKLKHCNYISTLHDCLCSTKNIWTRNGTWSCYWCWNNRNDFIIIQM
jgi:hypothetical protein